METDFLVIGSGIAGLSFALRAAELGTVTIVTKKEKIDSATNLAQGGIAAVLSSDDSVFNHIDDTLYSGAGLCKGDVVEMVVRSGAARIEDLISMGVEFVKDKRTGKLDLGREGGHSHRRVAHCNDLTGREIERALLAAVKAHQSIDLRENNAAIDLIIHNRSTAHRKCVGAYVYEASGIVQAYKAKVTVLCAGGCGKVYLYTSNPDIATGDGIAMAFRAGAKIANMEFVQFHPTCLYHPAAKNFLISEAVRGEGAVLIDKLGNPFMHKYDSREELATRDSVARAIDTEMKKQGLDCVYLDITSRSESFLQKRFPTIYAKCKQFGITISQDPIPVVPAAHYMCGGVVVDMHGSTSVDGLMALGETANTGLHGANRLASNSLLEAVVYAENCYTFCRNQHQEILNSTINNVDEWSAGEAENLEEEILINHNWDLIRRTMWNYVGIVRSNKRLELARSRMSDIVGEIEQHYRNYHVSMNMIELRNISLVAMMIIEAALLRRESRGLHFSRDFPNLDRNYQQWHVFARKRGLEFSEMECVEKKRIE